MLGNIKLSQNMHSHFLVHSHLQLLLVSFNATFMNDGVLFSQEGFGWTNGVALDLMVSYANQMEVIPFGIENTTLDYTDEELDYGCASAHATLISFTLITTVVLLNVLHLQV